MLCPGRPTLPPVPPVPLLSPCAARPQPTTPKRRRRRRLALAAAVAAVAAVAVGRVELLVDADWLGPETVRKAIRRLKDSFGRVRATLFASPGDLKQTRWRQLLREAGVRFHPVARDGSAEAEPTDKAIELTLARYGKLNSVKSIALLTHDSDFIRPLLEFQRAKGGGHVLVMVPEKRYNVVREYQREGLEVLQIKDMRSSRGVKVRALLHSDGKGSVELMPEPYQTVDNFRGATEVRHFLEKLGYCKGKAYLLPACAKFWVTNKMETPLTVLPSQLSTLAVHKLIDTRRNWKPCSGDLAFVLPMASKRGRDQQLQETYGNAFAYSVFKGNGPLVLNDSPHLAAEALRSLGYLDDSNQDLLEAMFCFVNSTDKCNLRKAGLLPKHGDNVQVVSDKVRKAFLSNATPGCWHLSPPPPSQSPVLKRILQREERRSVPRWELLTAMERYAQRHALPPMRTAKGLQLRIIHHSNQQWLSNTRDIIEIER